MIISGFPGIGKSTIAAPVETNQDVDVLLQGNPELAGLTFHDSDSSKFSWSEPGVRHPDWPQNYLEHIQSIDGENQIVFVSTHAEVRHALHHASMPFMVVAPHPGDKDIYLQRYLQRGSSEGFVNLLTAQWDNWLKELAREAPMPMMTFQLRPESFLLDQLPEFIKLYKAKVTKITSERIAKAMRDAADQLPPGVYECTDIIPVNLCAGDFELSYGGEGATTARVLMGTGWVTPDDSSALGINQLIELLREQCGPTLPPTWTLYCGNHRVRVAEGVKVWTVDTNVMLDAEESIEYVISEVEPINLEDGDRLIVNRDGAIAAEEYLDGAWVLSSLFDPIPTRILDAIREYGGLWNDGVVTGAFYCSQSAPEFAEGIVPTTIVISIPVTAADDVDDSPEVEMADETETA